MSPGHDAPPRAPRAGGPPDRRDDVVRLLSEVPEGMSDGELARALGDGVRPQTVNALCRRMVAEGRVERAGTRPIRNRLVGAPAVAVATAPVALAPAVEVEEVAAEVAEEVAEEEAPLEEVATEPRPEDAVPADLAAAEPAAEEVPAAEVPTEPRPEDAVRPDLVASEPVLRPAPTAPAALPSIRPARDAAQAWSRTVNVQAAVAHWLCARGATIRSATLEGSAPARDLVARLDGDDVHVEVTGWPPGGDRTHPTTIAADWFSAAARAAVRRRDGRPHARIVIALPDTRRYRALAAQDPALDGARTEVWFVDPSGDVDAAAPGSSRGR